MATAAQSVGEFVNNRVQNGYKGALTLEERRRRMREGVEHVRNSVSPRPRRGDAHHHNSISSHTTATSFDDFRRRDGLGLHTGDRYDTDTADLDDTSTIGSSTYYSNVHQMKVQENGQLHEYAVSPTPDGYSASERSNTEEEDDRVSVAASSRTEPQSLNGALAGRGQNIWTDANIQRPRTASTNNVSKSLAQINGHQPQQHHFSRSSMLIGGLPYHAKPTSHSTLRTREISAPPSTSPRTRPFSPPGRREMTASNNFTNILHAPTSHPLHGDLQTPPIDEGDEFSDSTQFVQAKAVTLTHKHSISNMSQSSFMSRTSSINDMSGSKSGSRFRTKRSHAGLRRTRRTKPEDELDYNPRDLSQMTYQQLADEDFDTPPKKPTSIVGLEFPAGMETLEEKCEHMRKLPDTRGAGNVEAGAKSAHEIFFANLPIAEYEDAGDIIVAQLGEIMGRLRKVRQQKRKVAREFEAEVAKREDLVRTKTNNLQKELQRLKRSGQEALTAAIASNAA